MHRKHTTVRSQKAWQFADTKSSEEKSTLELGSHSLIAGQFTDSPGSRLRLSALMALRILRQVAAPSMSSASRSLSLICGSLTTTRCHLNGCAVLRILGRNRLLEEGTPRAGDTSDAAIPTYRLAAHPISLASPANPAFKMQGAYQ